MRVIGTAGHVDHGKSTLVQALTGIDPDRLQEEKARGMTIDLGFAWIDLPLLDALTSSTPPPSKQNLPPSSTPTQDVGIVDVPGHIDFIKNMLAGIGSVDACTLVIAADEGVMPQTREHLAILDLLAVPAGVIALTKVDLIDDEEWLDLIELDVVELLQDTRLKDAPIVRVSAATGAGLDDLQHELAKTLARLAPRRNRARPRLPADRIFSISGFGTIVTGTLSDGSFAAGDAVEILPQGKAARIRGLQTHNQQVEQGRPGSRLAINLSGIGVDEIRRGDVITKPDTLRSTILVDVEFRLLADAPKPLIHNQAVDFFSGAAEVPARVRLIGSEAIEPGESGWLQLRLERPTVVAAGDRYILRQPSPSMTLGGGTILSPHPRRRWRRFDAQVIERLQTLAQGDPSDILLQTLSRHLSMPKEELIEQSGLDIELASGALQELQEASAVVSIPAGKAPALLSVGAWQTLNDNLTRLLENFHADNPLRVGMQREELRNRLQAKSNSAQSSGATIPLRFFNALIDSAVNAKLVGANDTVAWRTGFAPQLTPQQQRNADRLLGAFAQQKFSPPNSVDSLQMLDDDEFLLEFLIESKQLIRLGSGVLFRQQDFDEMQQKIQAHARENSSVSLAEVRDIFQTSRKYAQAVLEEMDARKITRRDGDIRVLR